MYTYTGVVYFSYGKSVSAGVNITGNFKGTYALITAAVLSLADLQNNMWPDLAVNVTG
jgi:hypothetical protein